MSPVQTKEQQEAFANLYAAAEKCVFFGCLLEKFDEQRNAKLSDEYCGLIDELENAAIAYAEAVSK